MNKIAYCGLNCEECDAYLATINDDQELRKKTAKKWSELNNVDIRPEHINCVGCKEEGVKTLFCDQLCEIRQCALKKNLSSCGECKQLEECATIEMIIKNNESAFNNLKG